MRFTVSDMAGAYGLNHANVLRLIRLSTILGPIAIVIACVSQLGCRPIEIMARISYLRRAGACIRLRSGEINADTIDRFIPALLTALSILERQETARRTSEAVHGAKARGSSSGRPLAMTPERQAIAVRMLSQGRRGQQILEVIPWIGRAEHQPVRLLFVAEGAAGQGV